MSTKDEPGRIEAQPFAVYLTGFGNVEELRDAMRSGKLSAEQAWAIHILDACVEDGVEVHTALDNLRRAFAEFDSEALTSRANAIRMKCGGAFARVPDLLAPLPEQLALLARDLFPLLLLQPTESGYPPVDPYESPAWEKATGLGPLATPPPPAATRFAALLEGAPAIGRVRSGDDLDWRERIDVGRFRTGGTTGSRVSSLYCWILNEAFRATVGTGPLTPERFIDRALVELERFERSLTEEPVEIAVLHGLDGIYLSDDVEIEVPWGAIRRLRPEEVFFLEHRPHRHRSRRVSGISVVLEARATMQRVPKEASDSWWDYLPTVGLDLIERLQLALLLASDGSGTVLPAWTVSPDASHVEHPLVERDCYLQEHTASTIGRVEDAEVLEAIREWAARIEGSHVSALDTAARRLLRARLERARPDDALVDAVIALEALFAGSSRTEITFRVSSAVAWLLAPDDADDRAKIARQVKSLYGLRSAIVHGAGKRRVSPESLWEQQDEAVALVVRCFKTLYRERSELIPIDERGERLSLGLREEDRRQSEPPRAG